jgi:hypothetical protein
VLQSVAMDVTAVDLFFLQDNVFARVTCIYSNIALDTCARVHMSRILHIQNLVIVATGCRIIHTNI